jgi:hypothetical protein
LTLVPPVLSALFQSADGHQRIANLGSSLWIINQPFPAEDQRRSAMENQAEDDATRNYARQNRIQVRRESYTDTEHFD